MIEIKPKSTAWSLYALGKCLIYIGCTPKKHRQVLIYRLCTLLRAYGYRTEVKNGY